MSRPPTTKRCALSPHCHPEKGNALPGRLRPKESSFATLFPKYREPYLRNVWSQYLNHVHIAPELNLVEGSMTMRTMCCTLDPFMILKARGLINLLARSVPVVQALKTLQDKYACGIIKIGGTVRKNQRFMKQRQ